MAHAIVPGAVVLRVPAGGLLVISPTVRAASQLLDRALRGRDVVVALLLERRTGELRLLADRALGHAARDPLGVHVDAPPLDARRQPLHAALRLAAATMRRRTPAMWQALDTLASCGGNTERAAIALGCCGQAIRERRARAYLAATTDLELLLAAVLASPMTADDNPITGSPSARRDSQGRSLANAR